MTTTLLQLSAKPLAPIVKSTSCPKSVVWGLCCATLFFIAPSARAAIVFAGAFSYDTFIPGGPGTGVNAFNISNLTGSFSLPPDFPIADSLTFQSAVLTLTVSDLSQQVFMLGDIAPGFLVDMGGNPVIQVPSDQLFLSAELTATLSASLFGLSDGTSFQASSTLFDVLLLPSAGPTLTADIDNTTIDVSGSVQATVPEPATSELVLLVLAFLALGSFKKKPSWLQIRRDV